MIVKKITQGWVMQEYDPRTKKMGQSGICC